MMKRDIRTSDAFGEARLIYEQASRPGTDFVSDITDLQRSADGAWVLFTGTIVADLDQRAVTRICEHDLDDGSMRILTDGPNSDRHARISPDRTTIAFVSDRDRASDFQLYYLDPQSLRVTAGPKVDGWVEYCEWSPDGRRILLGVAGHGADLSSGQGAYTTVEISDDGPAWMPQVIGRPTDAMRRSAWIVDCATGALSCVSGGENIWEATWCGNHHLAVIGSQEPGEGAWYAAGLSTIDLATGAVTPVYQPVSQIGVPRSSPSGRYLAFVEAICSDRGYVAGDLRLCDLHEGTCHLLPVGAVDTSCIAWQSDEALLIAGHRGLETVVSSINIRENRVGELWQSAEMTTAQITATVLALNDRHDFAFVCQTFLDRPRIAAVRGGVLQVAPAARGDLAASDACAGAVPVHWQAPDGLPIEGWLLKPHGAPPYATILEVHGGPVLHWRPWWLGRSAAALMLLRRGYALFLPNPRGSSGRGQAFAARVVGDVGGADTDDLLSGIDHLVDTGIADRSRLGVTGLSYGGFMTCWLTTRDSRFGAAISVGPATNHVSHHLLGNIPQFDALFLQDHYTNLSGSYYTRSPLLYAHHSTTPTMLVCGDLDRCTPPEEALQFHNALLENGVTSVVVRYPQEGHGVHGMPAAIDFAARSVMWFESHIPPATIRETPITPSNGRL
ncbi:S9 family peptidase [Novosphingobium sp.]|uniref:S9 family peptidase n=1 Tax=Novosphingobium sp. TaxID=1874826 RepID=UPI003B51A198